MEGQFVETGVSVSELKQWLDANRLGKLAKHIEDDDDVTMNDLLEMKKEDLKNWVLKDLGLNTLFFSKLWNALDKKRKKSGKGAPPPNVIKIIMTEKEEKCAKILNERIKDIEEKENEFKVALKTLNNSKQREMNKISNTVNTAMQTLKSRQKELENILKSKCTEKERIIQNEYILLQNHRKTLSEANIKYNNMLENNEAAQQRNTFISSIVEKEINVNNLHKMELKTRPKISFNFQKTLLTEIKSFGYILGFETPFPPKIIIQNVGTNSMTIKLEKAGKQPISIKNVKYELRVQLNADLDLDEKKDENIIICTKSVAASNPVIKVDNLMANTMYYLLSRAYNEYGWNKFVAHNIFKQRTKNKVVAIVNYDGVFDKNSLYKGYEDEIFINQYTVNMDPYASMAAMTKPLVRNNSNVASTRWQVLFAQYDTSYGFHKYNFMGVISDPSVKYYDPATSGYHSYGITTAVNEVYVDGKHTTDRQYPAVIQPNIAVVIEYFWQTSTLIFKSNGKQLWKVILPQDKTWYPAIGLSLYTCKIIPFS